MKIYEIHKEFFNNVPIQKENKNILKINNLYLVDEITKKKWVEKYMKIQENPWYYFNQVDAMDIESELIFNIEEPTDPNNGKSICTFRGGEYVLQKMKEYVVHSPLGELTSDLILTWAEQGIIEDYTEYIIDCMKKFKNHTKKIDWERVKLLL